MSKQIVTLLYLNGITDFGKVEKYLGMNGGYYEIVYDGELRKLKMPGVEYPEDIEIELPKECLEEKIEELDNNLEKLEKNDFIFPDSLDNAVESAKNQDISIKVETYTFEDELEKTEKENEKFLEKINEKTTKKEPKISQKKIKIVESKKIDDDLDDFINTV